MEISGLATALAKKKTADTTIGPVFQVRDLTAGVNLRPSATNIKPNEARRLVNTLISNAGELGVYPGFLGFSTTSLGSRRAPGGKRVYLSGATFTLVGDNGNVYKPSDAGVWGATVLTGLHATNPMDFVYDRDLVAVFDSSSIPKKSTDGTTWTLLGIAVPTVAPTAAAVAGGTLTNGNTYQFSYAYHVNGLNQTGNESATVNQAAAGANLTVRVSVTASADPQVTHIKVYALDVTGGETVRRLAATITNATTTTDITAETWEDAAEAPVDNVPALPMSFGVYWKNRWWGRDATVKNRTRFSQIFQSLGWPSTFFVDIPLPRGEDITAYIPLGDVLVVMGYTTFYLIIGQTSLDFEVRPALGAQAGAFGFHAVDLIENGVAHAGVSGMYLFNGASDELLSYAIDPAWQDMVDGTAASELANLPVVYHKQSKELRVGVSDLYPTGGRGEWVLDLNRTNAASEEGSSPAWFSTTRSVGGYIQWDGNEAVTGNYGRLFSWSPTIVKLFEERTGNTADGTDITTEYDGYVLPIGLQMARVIDTYVEYQPSEGTLSFDLRVDGRLMGIQSFTLGITLSRYGTATYGNNTYSGGVDRTTLSIMWPDLAEGRTAQLLMKYVGRGDFRLFTYGHNIVAESFPRGL